MNIGPARILDMNVILGKYMHRSGRGTYSVLANAVYHSKPVVVIKPDYCKSCEPSVVDADHFKREYRYIGDECEDPIPKNTW